MIAPREFASAVGPATNAARGERCRAAFAIACMAALALIAGCHRAETAEEVEPEVERSAATDQTVPLSEEAQKNIGLETVPVARRTVQDSLAAAGWLQAVPGSEIVIKAPATGFYLPESESQVVAIGSALRRGEELGALRVFLSPQEEAQLVIAKEEADILIDQSKVTMEIAEEQLRRLMNQAAGAVAGTRLQELEEIAARARVAHREAQQKLPYLPEEPYDAPLDLKPVPLAAAQAGTVVAIHASPRQFVIQGDPLWTLADWSTLWLRVPVFEHDFYRVQREESLQAQIPGASAGATAQPVGAPQAVKPGTRTIDLYYRLPNPDGMLRPGQAVTVSLPLGEAAQRIVVPRTAVIWDGFGNAWVYVQTAPDTFRRERVEPGPVQGDEIAIARGLSEGQHVVTTGTEALYGEEFRGQIQVEDGD